MGCWNRAVELMSTLRQDDLELHLKQQILAMIKGVCLRLAASFVKDSDLLELLPYNDRAYSSCVRGSIILSYHFPSDEIAVKIALDFFSAIAEQTPEAEMINVVDILVKGILQQLQWADDWKNVESVLSVYHRVDNS